MVYNLSVWEDESYITEMGITHNCRCNAVQVRKGKYEVSDSKKAITEGEKATTQIDKNGKNKLEIFRFNPGVQKVVFPPSHPYAAVAGAKKVKELSLNTFNVKTPEEQKLLRKEKDLEIKEWAKANVPESGKVVKVKNFQTGEATILRKNVKGISDHFSEIKYKDLAKEIIPIIKKANYIGTASLDNTILEKLGANLDRKKARGVTGYNYYEFDHNKETFRLNVEVINGKEFPFSINKIVKAE